MTHAGGAYTSSGTDPYTTKEETTGVTRDDLAQPSTTSVAKDEAAGVATSAKEATGHVAQTAAGEAKEVAAETRRQARNLMREGQHQVREQARSGQYRAAESINTLADELRQMANSGGQSGVATEVARQAADRLQDVSAWLSKREPGDLVNELRSWARQHPGAFLFGAALAGVVAGRLTGGAVAAARESQPGQQLSTGYGTTGGYQTAGGYQATGDSYYTGEPGMATEPLPTQTGGPMSSPSYPSTGGTYEGQQGAYEDPYRERYQDPYRQSGGQVSP